MRSTCGYLAVESQHQVLKISSIATSYLISVCCFAALLSCFPIPSHLVVLSKIKLQPCRSEEVPSSSWHR
ncbi:hypothetical protein RchiOBHm_Chr5g0015671 [Rosa chinensis]|uniref:Uncharacterized protein n=1 Tax=Rosa chinensis TaxID=74649 RepID=A0A2P6Q617_ROSCH|nr:hypothetical protein RchiOBHm_Chr5g0015671 [Rosa chinensis]